MTHISKWIQIYCRNEIQYGSRFNSRFSRNGPPHSLATVFSKDGRPEPAEACSSSKRAFFTSASVARTAVCSSSGLLTPLMCSTSAVEDRWVMGVKAVRWGRKHVMGPWGHWKTMRSLWENTCLALEHQDFFKWSKVKSSNKVISPCQFGARRQSNLQQRLVAGYIFRIDVMSSITMYHSFLHYSCDCPHWSSKPKMAQEKWAWCLSSAHLSHALSSTPGDCPNPNSWSKSPLLLKSIFPSPNLLTPWCRPLHPPYSTMGTLPGLFEACNQPTKGQLTDGQGRHVRHDVPRSMRRVLELLCCEFSVHTVWNGNKNNPPLHRGSEIKDYSDLIHFVMSKGWESEDKNMDFWRV